MNGSMGQQAVELRRSDLQDQRDGDTTQSERCKQRGDCPIRLADLTQTLPVRSAVSNAGRARGDATTRSSATKTTSRREAMISTLDRRAPRIAGKASP